MSAASDKLTIPYGSIASASALGRLIRAKRRQIGMTQTEASALAGVGIRFLSELENGKATAELGKVLQVLARLGLVLEIRPRSGGR
jgi:y4mF family transcriptional regulator